MMDQKMIETFRDRNSSPAANGSDAKNICEDEFVPLSLVVSQVFEDL